MGPKALRLKVTIILLQATTQNHYNYNLLKWFWPLVFDNFEAPPLALDLSLCYSDHLCGRHGSCSQCSRPACSLSVPLSVIRLESGLLYASVSSFLWVTVLSLWTPHRLHSHMGEGHIRAPRFWGRHSSGVGRLSSICPDLTGGLLSRGWRDCSVIKCLQHNPEAPSLSPPHPGKEKGGVRASYPSPESHIEDPSDITSSQPGLISEP